MGDINENEEIAMVQTCGVCETICNVADVDGHACLEGFGCYVDEATRYFYPLLNDGKTCLRRAYIDGVEQIVEVNIGATFNQHIRNCQLANSSCQSKENAVGSKNFKTPSKRKASKKLSVEEEEHLILAIQHRRPLWDISQPVDRRSKKTRKRLWQEVADELNGVLDATAVQQKFKSLRDTYRKIVQSEQYLPSGSGRNENEDRHKWKHYNIMEFLRDTSLSKDTSSNIPSTENELLSVDQSTSQVESPIDIDPNDSSSTETPTLSSTFTSGKRRRLNTNSTINSNISVGSTNPLDKLIQIFERREKAQNVAPPNIDDPFDEVDHMLQTAALHLRKMSPQLQMRTLHDIVQMTFSRLQEERNNN
ncbi:uncharacterized protein LOC143897674 isoform X2 [Temnothorax americanus]|uniref:uncharacterized protein LOC143897674 isoform X2 n=1 Tax=Temnothorax americanus TaxID=1964332 RepID=UPI00406783B1